MTISVEGDHSARYAHPVQHPTFQFHFRAGTDRVPRPHGPRYPSRRAAKAVCATQMWLSMAAQQPSYYGSREVAFRAEQKTSLPKNENICFSIGEVSGKREATSRHGISQSFGILAWKEE